MKPYKLNLLHQCVACAGGCVYRKRHFVAVMNVGCLPNQARVEMSSEDQSLCSGVTTKPKPRYPRPDQTKNRIGGKLGILERNHVRVVRERFETTPIAEPFGPKVAKCSIVEHSQAVSEPDEGMNQFVWLCPHCLCLILRKYRNSCGNSHGVRNMFCI